MRITIPSDCKKIHILFSGGMDSSILLYLLAKQVMEDVRDIPIICHTFLGGISKSAANKVIQFITKKFTVHISHRYHGNKYKIREITHLIQTTEPGYVFSGCNKVVDGVFTPTQYIPGDTPPWRGPALNNQHIRPFIEMDKIAIVQIYVDENVLDLLSLTHSCGVSGNDKCGGCYFCMERQWAIDFFGIIDT